MMDNTERYHTDEEFRKRFIGYVRKYQRTKKGKESVMRARKKLSETTYLADYCKRRREEAKAAHICTKCLKNTVEPGYVTCERCLEKCS